MRPLRWLLLAAAGALVFASLAQPQNGGAKLAPLNLQAPENVDLVDNSGFEAPQSKSWRFSDWPPREGTRDQLIAESVFYSQDVVHVGDWALCFDLTTVGQDRVLLAQQKGSAEVLAPYEGRRMRLSAWLWQASGRAGYQGGLTLRQWGAPGTPPLSHVSVRMPAVQGEWAYCSSEFTLRMGETQRWDVGVGMRQVPDLSVSPVVYVDDVKLEALAEPRVSARLLCGETVFLPDNVLPIKVELADDAWGEGLRNLRWNVTSPDGLTGYDQGDLALNTPSSVVEVTVPELAEGGYAVRLAVGAKPGERDCEVLLPFRRAEGPFAH